MPPTCSVMGNSSILILWLVAADTPTDTDMSLNSVQTAEGTLGTPSSPCVLYEYMLWQCHISQPHLTECPQQQYTTCYVYDILITVRDRQPHLWILQTHYINPQKLSV